MVAPIATGRGGPADIGLGSFAESGAVIGLTMDAEPIEILLATYNGAQFLAPQLDSIERQTIRSWRLMVRDDGSTDSTGGILADFRRRHPDRVRLVEDTAGRLGALGNYGRLLELSAAEYVCFCDQDDVWMPDRIERLLGCAEARVGKPGPLLVHSDLEVVDRDLQTVAGSLWRYQYIRPERCRWQQLLVQNVVTGCASLLNRDLRDAVLPVSRDAVMHDWWIALVAASVGEIRWVKTPTVRYRQHGANDTGAKPWGMRHWVAKSDELFRPLTFRQRIQAYRRQAAALAAHRSAPIPEAERDILTEFAALDRRNYPTRLRFVVRHGIMKTGLLRNLIFLRSL